MRRFMERAENRLIVFRADAAAAIGTGHVMRLLALAQAWCASGGEACFVGGPGGLEQRLLSEGFQVVGQREAPGSQKEARWTADFSKNHGALWLVVDGYHFGADYQETMKEAGLKVLFVDDHGHSERYAADIVLNQNLYADESFYRNRQSYTRLLLGTRYALLRSEFSKWHGWTREIRPLARNILVTLGGADAANVTSKVLEALRRLDVDIHVKVVAGAVNGHLSSLRASAAQAAGRVEVLTEVTDVAKLMAWADLAISAGGSTCWEIAFMGLPSCVIVTANNQLPVARSLEKEGAAINIGWWQSGAKEKLLGAVSALIEDPALRRDLGQSCSRIVDGAGARRVADLLRNPATDNHPLNVAQEA
jgi:UDP-2,4-diacetamido-2,4,6-trideoxy-beta-L-altropyranose hydrolase